MVCDDLHRGRCQFLVCFRHCSSLPSHRLQKPKSERERELPMGKQYRIISVWLWSGDFNIETTVSLSENDQKSFLASMNDQEGCEDLFKFSFKDWELNNPGYRLVCVRVCVCVCVCVCVHAQSCLTLCSPSGLHPSGLHPSKLLSPWDFPGNNTGCHFLLQRIFPNQGLSLSLLNWQANSLPLSHQGSTL